MKPFSRGLVTILLATFAAAAGLCVGDLSAAIVDPGLSVSQKGRQFNPGDVALRKGETLMIVNDDADLLHHAYIEAEAFNFDSGDQEPGSRTPITFTTAGDFKVLCGIHPKMKLVVHVK